MTEPPPDSGPPPQGVVMQMMMAAWTSQTVSSVTRLGVPDLLQAHGALTARQLTQTHGGDARPELLERAVRACASVGVFTEDAEGRFGPTRLSEVLTESSPSSVKSFVELIGGRWWPLVGGLSQTLRAGQARPAPRAEPSDEETERFGRAMRSRRDSATRRADRPACARGFHSSAATCSPTSRRPTPMS